MCGSWKTCVGVLAAILLNCGLAQAVVTNLRLYHLGEADAGAFPGLPGNLQTVDSVGGVNAGKVGLTQYFAAPGLMPGSSLAMQFTNLDSRYEAAPVAGLTDNFGIEAYVLATTPADARFFYNGGAPDPYAAPGDGVGLGIQGGQYVGILGGLAKMFTGVPVIPGKPVEMALVVSGGSTTIYINGLPVNSFGLMPLPAAATDSLVVGDFIGNQSPPAYAGVVDEARVFTFAPGAFNPGTDLGPAAVPEPSTLALLGIGAISLLAGGWRWRTLAV
jgi:hypothetical protein